MSWREFGLLEKVEDKWKTPSHSFGPPSRTSFLPLSIHRSHQSLFDLPFRHYGVIGEEPSGLAALLL